MLEAIDMPEWAVAHLQRCIEVFGLEQWHIKLEFRDKPNDSDDADGAAFTNSRYFHAIVQLRRGVTEERGKEVIIHEALHIAFGRLDQAMQRIKEIIPVKLQSHADEIYTDALEQSVETMTRALYNHFKGKL